MFIVTIKNKPDVLRQIVIYLELGVTAFRVNLARGSIDDNLSLIVGCKETSLTRGIDIRMFVDLPGPKWRLGRCDQKFLLKKNERLIIDLDTSQPGDSSRMSISDASFIDRVSVNDKLLLNDINPALLVIKHRKHFVECKVLEDCHIYSGLLQNPYCVLSF